MNKKNVILIGFMGCGKTTVGRELAKNINFRFIDTDYMIQKEESKSIEKIFDTFGEQYFRKIEKNVCYRVSNFKNCVISTGGGIIKSEENMINLKKTGTIIYLRATPQKIYKNLKYDNKRPLLKNKDKIKIICDLLNERSYLYEKYADIIVDVDDNSPFVLAKIIKNNIKSIL
ncbi:shikimate kinase [uncultured Tyzzerella sp.]|uniref:shikimate kinase n=1 Tax=uncultured Tyzzerella sp. TaxID=2321398 RepID=UPI0029420856|nr:shikimate kinase [uncultured Tyzzerella sp.]